MDDPTKPAATPRRPPIRVPRQSRLAVTAVDPVSGLYPEHTANPNTYWIVFVDAEYPKYQGDTPVDLTNRQGANHARTLARNTVEDVYLELGTLLEVTYYEGQWWFTRGAGESPSDYGSEPESGSEQESGSGLGSEAESGGSEQESGYGSGSEAESGGSEKSTAVVKASWTEGGYTRLRTVEAPGVPFIDVATVIVDSETLVPIDPQFIEVCEFGTLKVIAGSEEAVAIGAKIIGSNVRIRLSSYDLPVEVTMLLVGTRKGFRGKRFGNATRADYEANEAKLKRYGQ